VPPSPRSLPPLEHTPDWGTEGASAPRVDRDELPEMLTRGASSARELALPRPPSEARPWLTARPAPRPHVARPLSSIDARGKPVTSLVTKPTTPRALQPLISLADHAFQSCTPEAGTSHQASQQASTIDLNPSARQASQHASTIDLSSSLQASFYGASSWSANERVQTPLAMDVADQAQAESLRTMLDSIGDAGGTASEAIALARRAAGTPPSLNPQVEKRSRDQVFVLQRMALQHVPRGAAVTSSHASLWHDGGLGAAHRKQARAERAEWQAKRTAWRRAAGLRRQLVQTMADREQRREKRAEKAARDTAQRQLLWQIEDDAALVVQAAFRAIRKRRAEKLAFDAAMAVRLARESKVVERSRRTASERSVATSKRKGRGAPLEPKAVASPTSHEDDVGTHHADNVDETRPREQLSSVDWAADTPLATVTETLAAALDSMVAELHQKLPA